MSDVANLTRAKVSDTASANVMVVVAERRSADFVLAGPQELRDVIGAERLPPQLLAQPRRAYGNCLLTDARLSTRPQKRLVLSSHPPR